jgi:cytochrome b
MTTPPGDTTAGPTRLVWDLPSRVAHWALVVTVPGAWITHYAGVQWFAWHRRLGYATLVIVAFRIVWGFIGTRHARFTGFLRGPSSLLGYLRDGASTETPGHNPLGALSVVAMLLALLMQAATGLYANDKVASVGPFFGWVTQSMSDRLTTLHRANSNIVLGLVLLHLAAVGYYSRVLRKRLVRAIVTGRKDARLVAAGEGIDGSRTALAVLVAALLAAALALAVRMAPEASIVLF